MKVSVIITAGGIGKRMGAKEPKQFLLLCGRPILQRTIEQFHKYDQDIQVILTLPEEWITYWQELCEKHNFQIAHKLVIGGKERYHSIKNALNDVQGEVVLVHDGVRPLVNKELIDRVVTSVKHSGGVVPAIPMSNSIRKGTKEDNLAKNRSLYWEVQTPQGFMGQTLIDAYKKSFTHEITDDASLVEKSGGSIEIVNGETNNIKITSPMDMLIAERILDC